MFIYKSQFMPHNKIFQILGMVERNIRQSYTGAAVDVYKPFNFNFESGEYQQLYYYDVNSLLGGWRSPRPRSESQSHPFIMAKDFMPIGQPISFDGRRSPRPRSEGGARASDIRKYEPVAFGFFWRRSPRPRSEGGARASEIKSPDFLAGVGGALAPPPSHLKMTGAAEPATA
jgi:hypothetical protein